MHRTVKLALSRECKRVVRYDAIEDGPDRPAVEDVYVRKADLVELTGKPGVYPAVIELLIREAQP